MFQNINKLSVENFRIKKLVKTFQVLLRINDERQSLLYNKNHLKALEEDSPSHMSAARAEEAVRRLDAAEASPEPLRALARSLLARAPSTTTHL